MRSPWPPTSQTRPCSPASSSIQAQTHTNFICLISVDGDFERAQDIVRRACGNDDRFRVLGYENRLGFHHNFERALKEVPADVRWVALSDQDDYWYPEKLAKLLPYLATSALVTCQARVVSAKMAAKDHNPPTTFQLTNRKNVGPADLFANNQVTGSMCAFRREVLDLALPFPALAAPSSYHDHWIALCAMAGNGVIVGDLVLQDYIQHAGNVVGESRQSFSGSIRNTIKFARQYEGSTSPLNICRIIYKTGLGWRVHMARTLLERLPSADQTIPRDFWDVLNDYSRPKSMRLVQHLAGGWWRTNVPAMRALEIMLGILIGPITSRDALNDPQLECIMP